MESKRVARAPEFAFLTVEPFRPAQFKRRFSVRCPAPEQVLHLCHLEITCAVYQHLYRPSWAYYSLIVSAFSAGRMKDELRTQIAFHNIRETHSSCGVD